MTEPIKIAELERLILAGSPYVLDRQVREALLPLLRLARAADRYAWMLSKDGPPEVDDAIVAEWIAARAALDFTTEETTS